LKIKIQVSKSYVKQIQDAHVNFSIYK